MDPVHSQFPSESEKVISPFAHSEVSISSASRANIKLIWIVCGGVLLLMCGIVAGIFVMRYLNDPYRTLESFPVSKYFDNYQSLAGSKFKAELRVEADLGWKDGAGRLMLFSTADDPRPIGVLIPVSVTGSRLAEKASNRRIRDLEHIAGPH